MCRKRCPVHIIMTARKHVDNALKTATFAISRIRSGIPRGSPHVISVSRVVVGVYTLKLPPGSDSVRLPAFTKTAYVSVVRRAVFLRSVIKVAGAAHVRKLVESMRIGACFHTCLTAGTDMKPKFATLVSKRLSNVTNESAMHDTLLLKVMAVATRNGRDQVEIVFVRFLAGVSFWRQFLLALLRYFSVRLHLPVVSSNFWQTNGYALFSAKLFDLGVAAVFSLLCHLGAMMYLQLG